MHINREHPGYQATMITDSLNMTTGSRLSSIHITLPWYITPELLRHRCFSFSSRSTRAVPVKTMLRDAADKVLYPPYFGRNQRGMQADEEIDYDETVKAKQIIYNLAGYTVNAVQSLSELDIHKQVANKYLIPFIWCDLLITSTTWANFLALRTDKAAAPEMQIIAELMADCLVESIPQQLSEGEWHTPFIETREHGDMYRELGITTGRFDLRIQKISAARCARVSVKTFDGSGINYKRDLELADSLQTSRPVHSSPFEHVAKCGPARTGSGNFGRESGWLQMRSMLNGHTAQMFEWKGKVIV